MAIASGIMLQNMSSTLVHDSDLIMDAAKKSHISSQLIAEFSVQVQEWKNVLIRGQSDSDREKYWQRSLAQGKLVQQHAKQLAQQLSNPEDIRIINEFISVHASLTPKYKQGFDTYLSSQFDAQAADKVVRGIDRAPTKLLKDLDTKLGVHVLETTEALKNDSTRLFAIDIPLLVAIAVILLGLTYFVLTQQFVKPLEKLVKDVRLFGESDFSAEIDITSQDELGQIAYELKQAQNSIKEVMGSVKVASQKMNESADVVNGSSSEIGDGIESSTQRIELAATAITEMSATVLEVARNTASAADAATSAEGIAQEGSTLMQSTITTINKLATEMDSSSGVIRKLEEDTNAIGSVLEVIRGIAEQTNLLALNAAIEAARAGEQGRGFAVVADEVRSLAQRTQESTSEIQQIIETVQDGAKNAVTAMNAGSQATSDSVSQANIAGQALQEIMVTVKDINAMNTQIASAVEEQTVVSEEISQNINGISDSTREINSNINDFTNLSQSLVVTAEELDSIVNKISV